MPHEVGSNGTPSGEVNLAREIRERIKSLITPELIAEHAHAPLAAHSDSLARVLTFFRTQPSSHKYIIVRTKPDREWQIAVLPDDRTAPVRFVEDIYFSEDEVIHAVFERRVGDLLAGRPPFDD